MPGQESKPFFQRLGPAVSNHAVLTVLRSAGVAFCLAAGIVLSHFATEPQPVGYLARPLLWVSGLALVIGLVSGFLGRTSVVAAAFVAAWVVRPGSVVGLIAAGVLVAQIVVRIWKGRFIDVAKPVATAAVVFLLVGLIQVVPSVLQPSAGSTARLGSATPTYLILVDGYPRGDTLLESGIDLSPFLDALRERGFDIYEKATSHHTRTFRTLTHMMTGEPMASDDDGSSEERRTARASWSLPDGFVQISSPYGPASIPGTRTLNPGGPSNFETVLLQFSMFGSIAGDYAMNAMRDQLDHSLDLLANTDETRVFAHLMAPHLPYLYEGDQAASAPECWPICSLYHPMQDSQEAVRRVGLYLEWLNPRLLDVVDSIVARHDDANIVLFSDHGGRFSEDDLDEWHRSFLAARTPAEPGLFVDSPHPSSILARLVDG